MRRNYLVAAATSSALVAGLLLLSNFAAADPATETPVPSSVPAETRMEVKEPSLGPVMVEPNGEPPGQPPVSARELRDFVRQFRDTGREAGQMLKQLAKVKGTDEWQATLKEVISKAADCVKNVPAVSGDEQREAMNDCHNERLWDSINEIREQFVPPQEIKNVLNEIKRQTQELNRYKKQLAKLGGGTELADSLLAQVEVHKNNITNAAGRDQREAMQEYWDAQMWEEVNKIRARVELPREMKNVTRELTALQRDLKNRTLQKAFEYFGIDQAKLQTSVAEKQATVEQVNALVQAGNTEEAFALVQDSIYEGWHPGDVRHFSGMMRDTYGRLRGLRDTEIKEQILSLLKGIVDTFNEGDYREARDGLVQFTDQLQRFDRLFRPYYRGEREFDDRTSAALEKLESLIQQKLEKGERTPEVKKAEPVPAEATQ
ncbi:MAG: hypothetical protein HYV42_04155 [Candidatus Magasanikbacteria bacterium]|nr:hypothetical protein [Candidatus Magasanikbacteria bacterium]